MNFFSKSLLAGLLFVVLAGVTSSVTAHDEATKNCEETSEVAE